MFQQYIFDPMIYSLPHNKTSKHTMLVPSLIIALMWFYQAIFLLDNDGIYSGYTPQATVEEDRATKLSTKQSRNRYFILIILEKRLINMINIG